MNHDFKSRRHGAEEMEVILEMVSRRTPVLHTQWCMVPLFDFWMLLLLRILGIRIVYTVHDALPHGDRSRFSKFPPHASVRRLTAGDRNWLIR